MQFKQTCLAVVACAVLASCGGGDDGPRYEKLVSFGDSLSDVGSYATAVGKLGGGRYTINGLADGVWVEQLAAKLELPVLCAAKTGLEATGYFASIATPVVDHPECTAYGQGGSQVANPYGPWNKAFLNPAFPAELQFTGQLGQLTVPVTKQIENHLAANGGSFTGRELVTVLAGANDIFVTLEEVGAGLRTPEAAGIAMATLGAELADLIKTQIVAKGARRVVVLNLPNIALTPATARQGPQAQALADGLTNAFNAQLKAGLDGNTSVLQVDLYTENTDHHANPAKYGLTETARPACTNLFFGLDTFLGSSLMCKAATDLVPGGATGFLFADGIHPTPQGHGLLRDMTLKAMETARW